MADSPAGKPPINVELIWEHDLVFGGKSANARITLDSASSAGPSPMQSLAFSLAGCMAMDVVHIIRKARYDLKGLRADLTAHRQTEIPNRFTAIDLHFTVTGEIPDEQVQRAVDLSHEKYCSVWHSMRQDIEMRVTFRVTAAV
jgi:putative redox protein